MIWSLLGTVAKGAVDVIKTRTETKKLMAEAEQTHIRKMAEGEIEYAIASQKNMQNSSWVGFNVLLTQKCLKKNHGFCPL